MPSKIIDEKLLLKRIVAHRNNNNRCYFFNPKLFFLELLTSGFLLNVILYTFIYLTVNLYLDSFQKFDRETLLFQFNLIEKRKLLYGVKSFQLSVCTIYFSIMSYGFLIQNWTGLQSFFKIAKPSTGFPKMYECETGTFCFQIFSSCKTQNLFSTIKFLGNTYLFPNFQADALLIEKEGLECTCHTFSSFLLRFCCYIKIPYHNRNDRTNFDLFRNNKPFLCKAFSNLI